MAVKQAKVFSNGLDIAKEVIVIQIEIQRGAWI